MFPNVRHFVESHFGLLMVIGLLLGLLSPLPGMLPDYVPPLILAVMMGFSYSKISMAEMKTIKIREISGFYVLRFLIVPFFGFLFFQAVAPDYAYAVLLLLLVPMAVSGAALSGLLGGNATLALTGTVVTSAIAPFLIPLAFEFAGFEIKLDTWGMFVTLSAIVFAPAVIYFGGIRNFEKPKLWVRENASFFSVVLFAVFITIVVSRLRDELLADPAALIVPFLIMGAVYLAMFALGWLVFLKSDRPTRIAYTAFSGINNIGLGVSLAIMYFPVQEKLYIILCEFLWALFLAGFQYFLKKVRG